VYRYLHPYYHYSYVGILEYPRLAFDIRSDGEQLAKFKRHQVHSDPELSIHATTDNRCANFSASTCPTQALQWATSSERGQAATRKISSAA